MKIENYPIVDAFKDAGFQLFYVGGYVRSIFTNEEVKDIDFATNATPKEMIKLCIDNDIKFRTTRNGVAHGTVVINEMEFTTFRKDVSCDGRNATVEFAKTIKEDLSRRDFTCNAMAINVYTGELIDPFDGRGDIERKIVRAVGNPKDRLNEDTLRAMRAIVRAGKNKFNIDYDLFQAIKEVDISNLSGERIRDELMKILSNGRFIWMRESGLFEKIIPELLELDIDGGSKHCETVYCHSFEAMENMAKLTKNPLDILGALIHDIGKGRTKYAHLSRIFKDHEDVGADMAHTIMERLKFSTDENKYVTTMVKEHMRWHFHDGKPSNKALRKAVNAVGEDNIQSMLKLAWCDSKANLANKSISDFDMETNPIWIQYQKMKETDTAMKVTDLAINGKDLIKLGLTPGPEFSRILEDCLDKVCDEIVPIVNEKEALLFYVTVRELRKMPIKDDEKGEVYEIK